MARDKVSGSVLVPFAQRGKRRPKRAVPFDYRIFKGKNRLADIQIVFYEPFVVVGRVLQVIVDMPHVVKIEVMEHVPETFFHQVADVSFPVIKFFQ